MKSCCLNFVFEKVSEGKINIVDAKPIGTKELVRFNRHKIENSEGRGINRLQPIQKSCGYKITCVTDGRFLNLFTDTLAVLKEKKKILLKD